MDAIEPSKFRGKICHTNKNGFGFISRVSIHHVSGPPLGLPQQDLMLHVNENTALGDPLPSGTWITFFVRRDLSKKSGLMVYDAQRERSTAPA